jgi:NitT/TauT family transport system permease protein
VRASFWHSSLYSLLGVCLLGGVWVAFSLHAGPSIIPPPWRVLIDTVVLLGYSHTWVQICITLGRVALGFLFAFVLGTLVGIITGRNTSLEAMFKPVILFLQGIPPLLWAIPLILLFGIGHLSPILVITLICFPLVALNVAHGMKTVPPELEEMMEVFAPGIYPKMRELLIPHLKPFFSASLKLGVSLGIKASVIGEYFGANNGIGFQIQAAYQSLQIRKLFAWGILLIILILLESRFLSLSEKVKGSVSVPTRTRLAHGPFTVQPSGSVLQELFSAETDRLELNLRGVCFFYQSRDTDKRMLLEDIDMTVPAGTVAVVWGESGVGKTTLLKLAAGILSPSSGELHHPERVGFVFQDDRLLPWKTVLRNLSLPLLYQGYSLKRASKYAELFMSEFGLGGWETRLPEELSGGMKKRATLARCFMRIPQLILLDEPMSGLHREARRYLWDRFFALLAIVPVPAVIVTHFPEEISSYQNLAFYSLKGTPAHLEES